MASKNTRFDHNRLEPDSVDDTALPEIYTPTEAAEKLAVKESWLRRKAGPARFRALLEFSRW